MTKEFGAFLRTLTTHDPQGSPIANLAEYRQRLASRPNVDTSDAPQDAYDRQGKPAKHVAPLVVDPTTLDGVEIPERRWIVQDWLPVGYATLLYGDGGTGKTLLAQQLLTACAVGGSWLGMTAEKCKTYAFFCEDDEAG